jgi:hypothetical protein
MIDGAVSLSGCIESDAELVFAGAKAVATEVAT